MGISILLLFICGNICEPLSEKCLESFYGNIFKTAKFGGIFYNSDNMPMIDYKTREGIFVGKVYNPLVVGWETDRIMKKKKMSRIDTLTILNFAKRMVTPEYNFDSSTGLLTHKMKCPLYKIENEYNSSLTQGRAIKTLIAAFDLSNDSVHLKNCAAVLKGFFTDIKSDGIRELINDSSWWYEEYASQYIATPFVLNGMLTSLLCVYEYWEKTADDSALTVFKNGVRGLEIKLPQFDRDGYMYYDLRGNICTPFYERYSILLLEKLNRIEKKRSFEKYINKWNKYQKNTPYPIKFINHPSKRSLGMASVQFAFFVMILEFIFIALHALYKKKKN